MSRSGKRPAGRWNPYLVGAGIGILSWVAFAVMDKPLGVSSSLSAVSGVCALPVLGAEGVEGNAYFAKYPFAWDYGMLLLVGLFAGALASAIAAGTWRVETVPTVWAGRFGRAVVPRLVVAFLGGVVIMYGARMAGGCTSGHGISGSLQLALSSWVFFLTLFASGMLTALLLFRKKRPASTD